MQQLTIQDPDITKLIGAELNRQRQGLEMIPSENFTSLAVMEALGSVLTNKYSEGYPGKRYYGGNEFIDQIEELCRTRAKKLFGVEHANVQPYSGSPANQAVYFALLEPGDMVLGMALAQGGHLTHGYKLNFSGRFYRSVSYGVEKENERLDYDVVREIAKKEKPKLIVCGATAYPRVIDFAAFRSIADEVGAYLLADISHITGLVLSGDHQSPVPYADIVTTTTHKTLRGPRGAMILVPHSADRLHDRYHQSTKRDLAGLVDAAIIPGLQGGPHNHQTAAIGVSLKEAAEPSFADYGHQIVKNAKALAESLTEAGLTLVTGGTDNHLLLVNLGNTKLSGKVAETLLDEVGITVNKNMIPFDPRKPMDPSGIRLGTPALTTRGFTEDDMRIVGKTIAAMLQCPDDESVKAEARKTIRSLTEAHPLYPEL
ncbi:serine hydroxymethyltransferase [Candidatus Uhrbacteria bacterium CG10_big_fil_rev_8_21_14_0_10_48_11]|uniref:Serine hydroxymethyltransferase n=1 Tax=Candidatus Uhrbacteria bacterium CG10_big_fil_rev_8_21_14_0_10_48_11 TaxID=1975037 RepID=A0A2M8LDQ5_9BACT|nr:MAG: serine hydroxymethyltransferase [Candidatus Uhrbacteria bacterium CG10_big_fil_rev_8_21_14_0_10_48_11]